MNIYVGNLPYASTEEEVKTLFEQFGKVVSVKIIMDKFSGKSKGFGFVEMEDEATSESAIEALNNSEFQGNNLRVSKARAPERRPRFGGGNDRGGDRGGSRGGDRGGYGRR